MHLPIHNFIKFIYLFIKFIKFIYIKLAIAKHTLSTWQASDGILDWSF